MKKKNGFTLIELLVVIAIIAILMAYAIPNYRQYVISSKRSEAHNKLLEIAGMYEKFYANTNAYPAGLSGGGANLSLTAAYLVDDNYTFTAANTATTWTITATATNGQTDDTTCPTITINNLGVAGPSAECWNN
jgi:type IV pilus assembly protein PilE